MTDDDVREALSALDEIKRAYNSLVVKINETGQLRTIHAFNDMVAVANERALTIGEMLLKNRAAIRRSYPKESVEFVVESPISLSAPTRCALLGSLKG